MATLSPTKHHPRTLSRQNSSPCLTVVGLPPPIPESPSMSLTLTPSGSSAKSPRSIRRSKSKPRIRRGDVESSATSGDESEAETPPSLFSSTMGDQDIDPFIVPSGMVRASPSVQFDANTTPKRKVATPIEPMTVGRGSKKRETIQERLANASKLKKSRSHGEGLSGRVSVSGSQLVGGVSGQNAVAGPSGSKDKVVVCVRIKPTSSPFMESAYDLQPTYLALSDNHPNVVKRGGKLGREAEYTYPVDMLLKQPSTTPELYSAKIAPLVDKAMGGFNSTIFAYGQTGSGKSFTMTGTSMELGIIPCAVDGVFDAITADRDRAFLLRVSYVEIYNETLRDLLNFDKGQKDPPAIHSGKGKVYVSPLVEEIVSTPQDVMKLLSKGNEGRKVGATDWNERSSRSHCVFTIVIESRPRDGDGDEDIRLSRLNLIDLAGSEKAVSDMERRGEGKHINQSLLALREVINKLTEKKRSHIPYRNSKLTHLLENALGGDSNICVICTMSAEEEHVAETLETLKFAGRCSQVETKAQKNILQSSEKALIRAKDAQIEELKERLRGLAGGSGKASVVEEEQVAQLAGTLADLEERKKKLTVKLAKLNGEILTSELPRLNGTLPRSPPRPKRRRISEFLGRGGPKTPVKDRRAVSGLTQMSEANEAKESLSESAVSDMRFTISAKDAEIMALRAQLEAARSHQASSSTHLLDTNHQLEITRQDLVSTIEDKQTKIDELETIVLDLRKSREDILIEDQNRLDEVQRRLDAATSDLQRAARVATGDLPSDLEREQEAFRQDLAQIRRTHEIEVNRLKGEMKRLKGELSDRWGVAENAIKRRQVLEAENREWSKQVDRSKEAVEKYDEVSNTLRHAQEDAEAGKEARGRVDFLEAANKALQAELARAEEGSSRSAELEMLVDELRVERMDAMTKVADMEVTLVELRENVEKKDIDLGKVTADLERRTNELAERDVEYDRVNRQVEMVRLERDETAKERDRTRVELEEFQRKVMNEANEGMEGLRREAQEEKGKKEGLEVEMNALRGVVDEKEKQLQDSQAKVLEVSERLNGAETEKMEVAGKLEAAQNSLRAAQQAGESHAGISTELESLRVVKEEVDRQLASVTAEHHQTRDALRSAQESVSRLEQEQTTTTERSTALQADLTAARETSTRLKQEKIAVEERLASSMVELNASKETISALQQDKVKGEEQIKAIESELGAARDALEQLQAAAGNNDAWVNQLRGEMEVAQQISRDVAIAKDEAEAELVELRSVMQKTTEDLESARQSAASLEAERSNTTKELESLRQAKDSAAFLQLRVNELESAADVAKRDLEASVKNKAEAEKICSDLQSNISVLEAELETLRSASQSGDARSRQLRDDVDDLTRQLESKNLELSDIVRRLEDESQARTESDSRFAEAEKALQAERTKSLAMGGVQKEKEALEQKLRTLREQSEASAKEANEAGRRIDALQEAVTEAEKQKVAADQLLIQVRKEAEATRSATLAAEKERDSARAEVRTQKSKLEELMKGKQVVDEERSASKSAFLGLEKERDEMRARLTVLEKDSGAAIRNLEDAHKQSASQLASARSDLDSRSKALNSAEKQLAGSKIRIEALDKEVVSLKSQLTSAVASAEKATAPHLGRVTGSLRNRGGLPTIHSADLGKDGMNASPSMVAMRTKHREELDALEQVIEEQQKTIDVQREKIVYWSNELEKQREVVRLLTSAPEGSPTGSQPGPGTRHHHKAHSISDSPSRLPASGMGKKSLTSTFTARNLALPSAPTPLPMHTGQYSNTASRKTRRITLDHNMDSLTELSKFSQAKAMFDTPEKATAGGSISGVTLGNTPKQRRP